MNNNKGFTLVELTIYMALFSMLLLVLTDLFVASLNVGANAEANSAVQQEGIYILSKINYDIRRASSINTPSTNGSSGSTLELTINGNTVTYEINQNNLELTNQYGTNQLNSPQVEISNINFLRLGNNPGKTSIQYEFTVESTTKDNAGSEIQTFESTQGLR